MIGIRFARVLAPVPSLIGLLLLSSPPLLAQPPALYCTGSITNTFVTHEQLGDLGNVTQCGVTGRFCPGTAVGAVTYEVEPGCDPFFGTCTVTARVQVDFPGNHQNGSCSTPGCLFASIVVTPAAGGAQNVTCGNPATQFTQDLGRLTVRSSVRCSDTAGEYTVEARQCPITTGCTKSQKIGLNLKAAAGCELPPPSGCGDEGGAVAGACCVGPGGSMAPAGGNVGAAPTLAGGGEPALPVLGPSFVPPFAVPPGLRLTYRGRSVGHPGLPELPDWTRPFGTSFTLDVLTRIVPTASPSRVWWITETNTYKLFEDPEEDGTFAALFPSDEHASLVHTGAGWTLTKLDGRRILFRPDGRWAEFQDRFGNRTFGTYTGTRLTRVDLADGRAATFAYGADNAPERHRIVGATEIGVGGTASRSWIYYYLPGVSDLLNRIDRPGGYNFVFAWNTTGRIPKLTEWRVYPASGTFRLLGVWSYSGEELVRAWRGAASSGDAMAWDDYQVSSPSAGVSVVTDPLGQATTYSFEREPSGKPRVTGISGDCPTCGLGPNSALAYDDPANPLRPTSIVDGRGLETVMSYDALGQMTSRTEASGTALARTTTYTYSSTYPALAETITRPSTAGGANERISTTLYDAAGNPESVTETGFEAGASFSHTTASSFNAAGQPLTYDPPGHDPTGTEREDDLVEWTYDPTRGNLLPLTRTDKTGTTSYFYDAYNRRIGVKDPNGVLTEYRYDLGDRLTQVIQRSSDTAAPGDPIVAADLVTTNFYGAYGDLACQVFPHGKAVSSVYDSGGRLLANVRANAVASPSATACVSLAINAAAQHYYVKDRLNRVTQEIVQDWVGGYQTVYSTSRVFANRCQLAKSIADPGGTAEAVTEYGYDCNGNLDRVWDANHPNTAGEPPTTEYAYDALDRLTDVKQRWAAGGHAITTYGYDVQDHLTAVTDAEGSVTSYVYSDRDLMTSELSPVSGATTHGYDEHGQLATTTDARGVVVTRTHDGLDRVLLVDYPGTELDTAYTYDDGAVPFSKGRLTAITRDNGLTVPYRYDRFGRTTQDGDLVFTLDKGGNRSTIGYPGGVSANFTYDYLDRPVGLTVQVPGQPLQTVARNGIYRPGTGSLRSLIYGNNLNEVRTYDGKNAPASIVVSSNRLTWNYTTDDEGNPTAISQTQPAAESRTFGYQDFSYFLTAAAGPWGSLGWSYDKIGNRLTELRNGVLPGDAYTYVPNAATPTPGNTATLDRIDLAVGGTKDYTFGPAGHLEQVEESAGATGYTHTAEGQLGAITRGAEHPVMTYDGRSFLREATTADSTIFSDGFDTGDLSCWGTTTGGGDGELDRPQGGATCFTPAPAGPVTLATYGSEGLLYSVERKPNPTTAGSRFHLFYLAGRPVAQVQVPPTGAPTWTYLTTDHLGTPVLATTSAATEKWRGGFEPFGTDWRAGTAAGASENGVFLRLPGQWVDGVWGDEYYNVARWYSAEAGRYLSRDPLGLRAGINLFGYVGARPTHFVDRMGLAITTVGCNASQAAKIHKGAGDAAAGAPSCVFCSDLPALNEILENLTVTCDQNEGNPNPRHPCGIAGFYETGLLPSYGVVLTKKAFDGNCGCMKGVILHEALHHLAGRTRNLAGTYRHEERGGDPTLIAPFFHIPTIVRRCFSCADDVAFAAEVTVMAEP